MVPPLIDMAKHMTACRHKAAGTGQSVLDQGIDQSPCSFPSKASSSTSAIRCAGTSRRQLGDRGREVFRQPGRRPCHHVQAGTQLPGGHPGPRQSPDPGAGTRRRRRRACRLRHGQRPCHQAAAAVQAAASGRPEAQGRARGHPAGPAVCPGARARRRGREAHEAPSPTSRSSSPNCRRRSKPCRSATR